MKRESRESRTGAISAGPRTVPEPQASVRVAYHDGPPAIHFAGLPWRRGVADTISTEKWAEMRARADFHEFDFHEEVDEDPKKQEPKE